MILQALIGQRYGNKFLQTSIPAEEYDLIRMVLHKHKGRETRTAPVLDKWYIRDNNSIAPVYVLQDVASVLPDIISVRFFLLQCVIINKKKIMYLNRRNNCSAVSSLLYYFMNNRKMKKRKRRL